MSQLKLFRTMLPFRMENGRKESWGMFFVSCLPSTGLILNDKKIQPDPTKRIWIIGVRLRYLFSFIYSLLRKKLQQKEYGATSKGVEQVHHKRCRHLRVQRREVENDFTIKNWYELFSFYGYSTSEFLCYIQFYTVFPSIIFLCENKFPSANLPKTKDHRGLVQSHFEFETIANTWEDVKIFVNTCAHYFNIDLFSNSLVMSLHLSLRASGSLRSYYSLYYINFRYVTSFVTTTHQSNLSKEVFGMVVGYHNNTSYRSRIPHRITPSSVKKCSLFRQQPFDHHHYCDKATISDCSRLFLFLSWRECLSIDT